MFATEMETELEEEYSNSLQSCSRKLCDHLAPPAHLTSWIEKNPGKSGVAFIGR